MQNTVISIVEMFHKSMEKNKNKIAVIYKNQSITYYDLDRRSNDLARKMEEMGIKHSDFVLLYAEKSIEMVIAIMASVKIGTIYVPIDGRYPIERINYIISDCKPKLVLTYHAEYKGDIPQIKLEKYIKHRSTIKYNGNRENLDYCIYTSGTTGKPKGVLIYDYSIVNLVIAYADIYEITDKDVLLQFASIAFDQSVWDIFTILSVGGTLCVMPQEYIGDNLLTENYIIKNNVTVAALTPAYLKELRPEKLHTLRIVESGGSMVERDVVKHWKKYCRVFNTYGPTEATVNAMSYELTQEIPENIPIGKPIRNVQAYIMKGESLCGCDVIGEICLGGEGIAKGYLNQPELNNAKFIDSPFGKGKLYRTGDLGKKTADGNFYCLGRIDDQLKIRGFRIDKGEIESCLKKFGEVVVTTEKNQLQDITLVAYIVSSIEKEYIYQSLKDTLPDYMIPSKLIYLDKMPLNVNGKVDFSYLHQMYFEDFVNKEKEYVAPVTEFQQIVASIIAKVLHLERYGSNYNFMEYGGNSINAIRVVSLLRDAGYKCKVSNLLRAKNIVELENMLYSSESKNKLLIQNDKLKMIFEKEFGKTVRGVSLLTPTQKYMYRAYIEKKIGDNFLQYVYTIKYNYDFECLCNAINLLPMWYDSLTSQFKVRGNQVFQVTFTAQKIPVKEINVINDQQMKQYMKEDISKSFDFETEPLMRFTVFHFLTGEKKLLCSVSHIIVDGWSMDLIIKTLARNYIQLMNGVSVVELEKVAVLMDFPSITMYNSLILQEGDDKACKYWDKYFRCSKNAVLTITHDNNAESDKYHDVIRLISYENCMKIRKSCQRLGVTENSLFELAFAYLLSIEDKEHRTNVVFSKVISGRDILMEHIDQMVGTMINIIPQQIVVGKNYREELREINHNNLRNMEYDKLDFYQTPIDGRLLMEEIKTMLIFCNYYDEKAGCFEYEYDRDQDDIDLSLYVDAMSDMYRLYLTCSEKAYSNERAEYLINKFINIVLEIADECNCNI